MVAVDIRDPMGFPSVRVLAYHHCQPRRVGLRLVDRGAAAAGCETCRLRRSEAGPASVVRRCRGVAVLAVAAGAVLAVAAGAAVLAVAAGAAVLAVAARGGVRGGVSVPRWRPDIASPVHASQVHTDGQRGERMSTDAIVLLKNDHKEIRKQFKDFQNPKATTAQKGKTVKKLIELLTVHTYIENEVMYPQVRERLPQLEEDVLESYEEHHVADMLVMELSMMRLTDERFDAKTTVLIENVQHHMDEEEQDWFPKVREGLGRKALQEIGAELAAAKKRAPKKPCSRVR